MDQKAEKEKLEGENKGLKEKAAEADAIKKKVSKIEESSYKKDIELTRL